MKGTGDYKFCHFGGPRQWGLEMRPSDCWLRLADLGSNFGNYCTFKKIETEVWLNVLPFKESKKLFYINKF